MVSHPQAEGGELAWFQSQPFTVCERLTYSPQVMQALAALLSATVQRLAVKLIGVSKLAVVCVSYIQYKLLCFLCCLAYSPGLF